jgi:hypothetical protein
MQKDINTLGYTQWYCFSIKNITQERKVVKLHIVNFVILFIYIHIRLNQALYITKE